MRALERAYAQAGVSPATVGLVEAHGTGHRGRRRREVEALTARLRRGGRGRQACALGSVKSMIGHTKAPPASPG